MGAHSSSPPDRQAFEVDGRRPWTSDSFVEVLRQRFDVLTGQRKGERTKARLKVAAAEALEAQGYRDMKVADIRRRADVSAAVPYLYFHNKTSLVLDVLTEFLNEFFATAKTPRAESLYDALRAANARWLRLARANAGLMKCLPDLSNEEPSFSRLYSVANHQWYQRSAEIRHASRRCAVPADLWRRGLMGEREYRLETERLVLRPFTTADAAGLQEIAGERRIVDTTISVPHPFTSADAANWIEKSRRGMMTGTDCSFAIVLSGGARLIGYAALHHVDTEHSQAEISFWIGAGFEGKGYVTEAARRLIDFAFDEIGLNRLCAFHMVRNRGSERVLEKLGFRQEGYLRQRVRKWGVFEDVLAWGLLDSDRSLPTR